MTRDPLSNEILDALPESFWLRQRNEILCRARAQRAIDSRRRMFALAVMALAALGLALLLPPARVAPIAFDAADQRLFNEALVSANGAPVRAVAPIALLIPAEPISREKTYP